MTATVEAMSVCPTCGTRLNDFVIPDRKREIYRFLWGYMDRNGCSPTMREIAVEFDCALSTVCEHITDLENMGALKRKPGAARGIVSLRWLP